MTLQQLTYLVTVADCGNITEAAESLFIHRNTMLKRIDKIEEILKMSLEKADVKNTLYNCYLIDKYIK